LRVSIKSVIPPPFELAGVKVPVLAVTPLVASIEFAITPVAVVFATA
jgi:hypothetical protein